MTTTMRIDMATMADASTIGRALAKAFDDDPVFKWIVGDPDARRARLPSVFEAFANVYVPLGESYVADDEAGAALWAPAGVEPFTDDRAEVFGQRMTDALDADAERAFVLDERLQEHHPEEACLFLQFVGVSPEHQGRGLGSRMLTTVLDRADTTGTPAYLEATSPDNRRLYERHGFETVGEITLPEGPTLWPMWRDPVEGGD